jgi:hypothetical protein
MRIVQRHELDVVRWDKLVADSNGTVFSCSFYLDAVAENWCVLVDDAYTAGIALPYTVKLGQKTLYTPFFVRYIEWFGQPDKNGVLLIKQQFHRADITLRTDLFSKGERIVYQEILPDRTWKLNEQSKRMLKRFDQSGLVLVESTETSEIVQVIEEELTSRVSSLNKQSLELLNKLLANLNRVGVLRVVKSYDQEILLGGAFFIDHQDRLIYLKSAFKEKGRKEGAMYAIMNKQIAATRSSGRVFDFGGSRVESVRRFNLNLGGDDVYYYRFTWDSSPGWFRMLHLLRQFSRSRRSIRTKM